MFGHISKHQIQFIIMFIKVIHVRGKRAGTTRHLHTGDVEHEPVSALRLCVNSARSDLTLEL